MSDDGEPHGTAGRPILQTLLHSGIGEVVAVVTRYFGGVKLGTGGLGRAYSESVSEALATLPRTLHTPLTQVRILAAFPAMDPLFRLLEEVGGRDREERYGEGIELLVQVPSNRLQYLHTRIAEITAGAGVVQEITG
jgi:putative IMPACT (imprinted ancient) family translation regulator